MADNHWSRVTMRLHWASALLLVGLAAVGLYMVDLPPSSPLRLWLSRLHVLFGAALMVLMVARLWFRVARPAPVALRIPKFQTLTLKTGQVMLYVLTFAVGASGGATSATGSWGSYLLGKAPEAPALELFAADAVHENLAFALLSLLAFHIGGVMTIELQYGKTLERMLPRTPASPQSPERRAP